VEDVLTGDAGDKAESYGAVCWARRLASRDSGLSEMSKWKESEVCEDPSVAVTTMTNEPTFKAEGT
jgi:hypothetical protein